VRILQISTVLIDNLFRGKHTCIPVDRTQFLIITAKNKQANYEEKKPKRNMKIKNEHTSNNNKIKMKKQTGVLKRLRSHNLCINYYIYTCSFFLDNSSCWRLCCSRTRPLQMIIYDNDHRTVMELNRPYRCRCSLLWCCCLQLMTMKSALGIMLGEAKQERVR